MRYYDNGNDYREELHGFWNENVKKFRRGAWIAAILMILCGILCLFFPVESMLVMEVIASILLIVMGVAEIYEYSRVPVYLRTAGPVVSGVLNILLGILLLTSTSENLIIAYGFIFGIGLITFGIEKIGSYNRLRFFSVDGLGWLMASGILSILCGVVLVFVPQASVALSVIVAIYLLAGGISLAIDAANAKELEL
jgi:uncharacterized membrane protein HdeD (DUF308 family)